MRLHAESCTRLERQALTWCRVHAGQRIACNFEQEKMLMQINKSLNTLYLILPGQGC